VIVNPQADRSKDWGEQAEEFVAQIVDEDSTGLTIRGAKMLGTSSIMANEVFVANLQSELSSARAEPLLAAAALFTEIKVHQSFELLINLVGVIAERTTFLLAIR
jgi:hypothetical protein